MIIKNFAVFEGIDGSGTTTQLKILKERYFSYYQKNEPPVFITFEPTDSQIGKLIRKALAKEINLQAETIARLFSADRCEHLYGKEGILDQIHQGKAVFSDRYLFSSLAYQGQDVDEKLAYELNKTFPLPEFLFYFDINPDLSMDRVNKRIGNKEIYEKLDFQKLVKTQYSKMLDFFAHEHPQMQIITIDASKNIEEIAESIWRIAQFLPKL